MSSDHVALILDTYARRTKDLRRDERFRHTIVFRNYKGEAGASLTHPHSQLIALPFIPELTRQKLNSAREYYHRKERCIFCDLLEQEMSMPEQERVIYCNDCFVILSPFAARFPFSVEIYPLKHSHDFVEMDAATQLALADALQFILVGAASPTTITGIWRYSRGLPRWPGLNGALVATLTRLLPKLLLGTYERNRRCREPITNEYKPTPS